MVFLQSMVVMGEDKFFRWLIICNVIFICYYLSSDLDNHLSKSRECLGQIPEDSINEDRPDDFISS